VNIKINTLFYNIISVELRYWKS